jgi:S1-C subfamily serine protease
MKERKEQVSGVKRLTWFIAVLLLSVFALSGCSMAALPVGGSVAAAVPATPAAAAPTTAAAPAVVAQAAPTAVGQPAVNAGALDALQGTLEQVYKQVDPSVVSVEVIQNASASGPFGSTQGAQQVLGSGFVWDKQGHIVTNNHVVDGAAQVSVKFSNGTIVSAKVIGTDVNSDLAVLLVNLPADALQPVQLADSTQVQVGQLAIAIGNPFGEEGTMTMGIISALGRTLPVQSSATTTGATYSIPDVIQTDAPINPGNSGGVLVNDMGQVIGVTAAIESPVQANSGVGFAIPSLIVQKVVPALIQTGHYDHPYLGLSATDLTPDLATAMGLNADQRGALIIDVTPGGPADKAGLHGSPQQAQANSSTVPVGGDVIVAVDGQPVQQFDDMLSYLARHTSVGQTITLTVLRDGKQMSVDVSLAARPQQQPAQSGSTGNVVGADLGVTGITVTPAIAQAMNLPSHVTGVLIEKVQPGGPADQAGLIASNKSATVNGQQITIGGDIIVGIDGVPITSVDDLTALLQQAQPGLTVTLQVLRDGQLGDVDVTLGQPVASTGS